MSCNKFWILTSMVTLAVVTCQGANRQPTVASSSNKLSVSLLPHLPSGNLVMSSFSLGKVLGMVLAGARGKTGDQILQIFGQKRRLSVAYGFSQLDSVVESFRDGGSLTLESANRIYIEKDFNIFPYFSSDLESHYGAKPASISFKKQPEMSRREINRWVSNQTRDRINDLLPSGSIDTITKIVLVNALYFKGDWARKFDPKRTFTGRFDVDPNTAMTVPMMRQSGVFGLKTIKELGNATALRMPYKGEKLDMIFILPHTKDSLDSMEDKMRTVDMNQALDGIRPTRTELHHGTVDVTIPKFKIESNLDLAWPLKKLGVTDMFDPGTADFSGINGRMHDLFVSLVVQKAFIEVNAQGAEAAVASGAVISSRCKYCGPPRFVLNRPFYYVIRERSTGLVLFSGRVVNPTSTQITPTTPRGSSSTAPSLSLALHKYFYLSYYCVTILFFSYFL